MVKSIHIQNFRCFEDFQLEGFGRVNLIGGMNNSGKTILLEGVWLGVKLSPTVLDSLKGTRYQHNKSSFLNPEVIWKDLFYSSREQQSIVIKTTSSEKEERVLEMLLDKELPLSEKEGRRLLFTIKNEDKKVLYDLAVVPIRMDNNEWIIDYKKNKEEKFSLVEAAFKSIQHTQVGYQPTQFPPDTRFNLAELYSRLRLNSNGDDTNYVLKAFQVIDSSIQDVEIFSLGSSVLYLKRNDEPLVPLEMFGDAIKRMAEIMIQLLGCKNGVLLIDEIENGIHYTNQPKVWELIFKLANKFNVQVFATTHSKEMVQAFNKVALEEGFEDDAKYIEMARHHKTKRIVGTVLETNILKHKLEHNQAFRGE